MSTPSSPSSSPPSAARTLVVMRHAKAEDAAASDAQRALTGSGSRAAGEAGAWLAQQGVRPDAALVSAAVRTVQTWAALAGGAGWDLDPVVDDALYEASPQTVGDLIKATSEDVGTLVVVGHNPTMASISLLLDDGVGDDEAVTEMTLGFPTAAVAVFGYDGAWAELRAGSCRVLGFHSGRS